MNSYYCLQCVERILGRIFLIVNICLWNDVVFFVTADKVDMTLAVLVYGSFQTQVLVDGTLELLTEVRYFLYEVFKLAALQCEENARCDGTYSNSRRCVVQEISLAEIFSL